ncbi:MAG: hypothetical protein PHE27_07895, partial [Alphaproteobacteria bacterium]|nr:hypothetical protein [Alphaproteobacteria bacterium]
CNDAASCSEVVSSYMADTDYATVSASDCSDAASCSEVVSSDTGSVKDTSAVSSSDCTDVGSSDGSSKTDCQIPSSSESSSDTDCTSSECGFGGWSAPVALGLLARPAARFVNKARSSLSRLTHG